MQKMLPTTSAKGRGKASHQAKVREFVGGQEDWDQKIVDMARVTRVTKGGKRMRFRACLLIGDRKGQVGLGVAKGADVSMAVNKAAAQAQKKIIKVPIVKDGTLPHRIIEKYGASVVLLKPAPKGSGIIAGGVIRLVLELAGVQNVVSKMLGSKNKINCCRATINALKKLSLSLALRRP